MPEPISASNTNSSAPPAAPQPRKTGSTYLLRRILGYFRPYWGRIAIATVAMGVVAAATAGSAYLVKPALDEIFINKNAASLTLLPALFVIVIAAKGAGRFVQNYLLNACGLLVLERLREQLYARIISLPLRFFEDNQVGMLMSRIITDVMMMRQSLPSIIQLIRQVLTMVALVGVVFYQDATLAILAVLVLPVAIYPFVFFSKKLRKISRKNQAQMADVSSFLQEAFSGVRVVKAFAAEDREVERFRRENDRLVRLGLKGTMYNELSSPIMELVGAVGMGLVIWYGGQQVISGQSTPGTFFSFLAGVIMLYDPIKRLDTANRDIQQALAGAERVFEILDSPELKPEQGGDIVFVPPFESLRFEHVSFAYSGQEKLALDDVTLDVKAGQRVAIVGPSGAGKTSLINLIPRFYTPDSGRILLNGRGIEEYTLSSLRLSMGMVSQEAFLFNLSIRDNIAYGPSLACASNSGGDSLHALPGQKPSSCRQEDIEAAAVAAYAHGFITALPDGYETVVGERGVKLSGGQKQRLTIARALLKNPPLLILDEATSALDSESERIVQQALENLMHGRTSIVIAHRLSTVLGADKIVVMEHGRIVGQGTHGELLETCPLYATLYRMQYEVQLQAPAEQGTGAA